MDDDGTMTMEHSLFLAQTLAALAAQGVRRVRAQTLAALAAQGVRRVRAQTLAGLAAQGVRRVRRVRAQTLAALAAQGVRRVRAQTLAALAAQGVRRVQRAPILVLVLGAVAAQGTITRAPILGAVAAQGTITDDHPPVVHNWQVKLTPNFYALFYTSSNSADELMSTWIVFCFFLYSNTNSSN